MTVKSAMNHCSHHHHHHHRGRHEGAASHRQHQGAALWSPCCGGGAPATTSSSAASSFDDDPARTPADLANSTTTRRRLLRLSWDVDRSAAERRDREVHGVPPPEPSRRRPLPRPAPACTARQPAVVSHTVHSREIDRPLPQRAVGPPLPPPTVVVPPRSAPPRRRHLPDANRVAAPAQDCISQWWKHRATFDELPTSRDLDEVILTPPSIGERRVL